MRTMPAVDDRPAIRRYRPNDHEGLLDFLARALTEMGYEFLPDEKDADVRDLDSVYLHDQGAFYVVDTGNGIQGCVGIRRFSTLIAELKRLYVAKAHRGRGVGRALCLAAIEDARMLGYEALRLDTTHRSVAAVALFKDLGFEEIPRYNSDEFAEIFFEKSLKDA